MAEISVRLTANIKQLEKALRDIKKDLTDVGERAENTQKKVSKGGDSFNRVGKSASNATPALQEFSRVIQDAPFGIQGVGNNIQQLTANFGNLSKSAGGSVPALKAMFGALAGPGGILLAVSAVTSLLTVYGDKLKLTTNLTQELTKATGEFIGAANLEVNTLKTLFSIASDVSNSYKVRKGALDELNENYKDYLGNLELEELNSKKAKTAVDNLTKSIIQQAKVRGVQKILEEKLADRQDDLAKGLVKQKLAQEQVENEVIRLNDKYKLGIDLTKGYGTATRETFEAINKLGGKKTGIGNTLEFTVNQYQQATDDIKKITNEIERDIKPLNNIFSSLKIGELLLGPDADNGVTVTAPLIPKDLKTKFKNTFKDLDEIFAAGEVQLSGRFDRFSNVMTEPLAQANTNIKPQLANLEQSLIEFNSRAGAIINEGTFSVFAGIGEAIGGALANGGNVMDAVGKSLLSSLGGILVELGKMAIAVGVGIKAVKTALKSLNPVVAIAAGVGLVAIGSAFKGAAGKLSNSFGGGGGFGSSTIGGQSGFSTPGGNFGASASGFSTVVFEIAGTKLLGVLRNTQERNLRLGGGQFGI